MAQALTACVKEIAVPSGPVSNEVSFIPAGYTVATTKANTAFDTAQSFGCYAIYAQYSNDPSEDAVINSGNYMVNQEVHAVDTNEDSVKDKWVPTIDFYWPRKNRVNFVSYAPYSANAPWLDSISINAETGEITATAENKTPGASDDWLIADLAADYNDFLDGAASNDVIVDSSDPGFTGVPALFRHALARVSFNVKADFDTVPTGEFFSYDETEGVPVVSDWAHENTTTRTYESNGTVILETQYDSLRTVTTHITKVTVTTNLISASGYNIKFTKLQLRNAVTKGTLTLSNTNPDHTQHNRMAWNWTDAWTLASGETRENLQFVNYTNADDGMDIDNLNFTQLVSQHSVIPQSLSNVNLYMEWYCQLQGARLNETTTTEEWDVVVTERKTHVIRQDLMTRDKLEIYNFSFVEDVSTTRENYSSDSDTIEINPGDAEQPFTRFDTTIGLYNAGNLASWEHNKNIIYNILIEPSGRRITWDPAQVTNWGSEDNGSIDIN